MIVAWTALRFKQLIVNSLNNGMELCIWKNKQNKTRANSKVVSLSKSPYSTKEHIFLGNLYSLLPNMA